jgi:DNA-binding transcriptional regulator YhcF (GntR family)
MANTRQQIADILRGRILRGLNAGAIEPGERLPSARELRSEFGDVDHRIILDGYRELQREGLVELRARGGIYVAPRPKQGLVPLPSAAWMTDLFSQAIIREIPLPEMHMWVRRAIGTLRLRVAAIQTTADQIAGLARELRDDYGLVVAPINASRLSGAVASDGAADLPGEIKHADLLVTTGGLETMVRAIADKYQKPLIVVDIRADLIGGEWRLLLRKPVYVVVSDDNFVKSLKQFLSKTPGAENARYLVLGRDSVDQIPDDAPVYVTRSARDALRDTPIRGRLLPSARLFSDESSRQLIRFIVDANLRAMASSP